ncbi:SflA family class IV lanthipeptide [Kitasatospora sp. NPDC004799]|uniref:SflA family class IV lanthipeptide n=1 Tax=Kitasatospora sp. NPDC004799 TaxID=3154460 RepID=UPI0033B3C2C3
MSALMADIRDAGALVIDEDTLVFEDEFDADLTPVACIDDVYVTYVPTSFPCEFNS